MPRPVAELPQWAALNDVAFRKVQPSSIPGRGSGLVAKHDLNGDDESHQLLLTVPRELVLSKETVELLSKSDRDLRALLEALGEFVQTPRGAILTFLLYVTTMNKARKAGRHLGSLTPFNQYVQFLPPELLPTFWTEPEVSLLHGTSLASALRAKMRSLEREFETLVSVTQDVPWCTDFWHRPATSTSQELTLGSLTLNDWLTVDSMYRSRALEFPGIGDAMVPCIDVANHASGAATSALYETDADRNAVLLLRPGMKLAKGGEVTITYGDAKGACEMLFSYGFIEDDMDDARELFLPLSMAADDPLAGAKNHVNKFAPGVKIYRDSSGEVKWHSEYVFLIVLNQEDGLDFRVAQTVDGGRSLEMSWHEHVIATNDLGDFVNQTLQKDEFAPLYRLRACVTVLDAVRTALAELDEGGNIEETMDEIERNEIGEGPRRLATILRDLEGKLLRDAVVSLEGEVEDLMNHPKVGEWFQRQREDAGEGNGEGDEGEEVDFT